MKGGPAATAAPGCPACGVSVRVSPAEVERILNGMLASGAVRRADEQSAIRRLELCRTCPSLDYGTTCRYCGCLVDILARLAGKRCPHPAGARW